MESNGLVKDEGTTFGYGFTLGYYFRATKDISIGFNLFYDLKSELASRNRLALNVSYEF